LIWCNFKATNYLSNKHSTTKKIDIAIEADFKIS
jgi:hypothetical protein